MKTSEQLQEPSVRGSTLAQKIRIPIGFGFALVFLVFSSPSNPALATGLGLAMAGLLLRLWAAGHLRKHRQLTITGPYRKTRNPLYLGSFLMGLGFSIASSILWIAVLFLVLFLAIYFPVMKREEIELSQAYGAPYKEYLNSVPRFLPAFRTVAGETQTGFSFRQVLVNREYNAVLGYLIVSGFLIVKMMWL